MSLDELPDKVLEQARELAKKQSPAAAAAFDLVEGIVRKAVSLSVREVTISAPGVDLEDARTPGRGAELEDVRRRG